LRCCRYLGWDRQRYRGFFSAILRGVSNLRESSKILGFLFRSSLVCCSLPHLRNSWKGDSSNLACMEFFEVLHNLGPMRQDILCRVKSDLGASYIRSDMISGKYYSSLVGQAHRTGLMQPLRSRLTGEPRSLRSWLPTRKNISETTKISEKRRPMPSKFIGNSSAISTMLQRSRGKGPPCESAG
jgi:hypothetical protein